MCALFVTGGCRGGDQDIATGTTTSTSSSISTTTVSSGVSVASTVENTEGSALRRRDVPPDGVAAQLGSSLALTDGCDAHEAGPLEVAPLDSSLQVGASTVLCVNGFAAGPVRIQVRLPDGRTRDLRAPDRGDSQLSVAVLDPLGRYVVTATQGERTATVTVGVSLPDKPVIETLEPTTAPPGTTFRFGLASPRPRETIELDLYLAGQGPAARFLTTLPAATTDGSARTRYQLPTFPDDPPGDYCLRARRQSASCTAFFTVS